MSIADMVTGDTAKFSEKLQAAFNKSIEIIPPEIMRRGKGPVTRFFAAFYPSRGDDVEKEVAGYWDECNLQLK